jgi:hypothetical protein
MHPAKTELARNALAARDPALGLIERRLLILCDGKRPPDELTALLGPDTPSLLERLQEQGFLTRPPVAAAPAPEPATTTRNRRSAAIARIYMTDMLKLMRRDDADAMATRLHAAATDPELRVAVEDALRFISDLSGQRYARRIATRVAEVAPQAWLSGSASMLVELTSDGTAHA